MQLSEDVTNAAELAGSIPGQDRQRFQEFKALAIQAAFDDRVFIVYKPQGLNSNGTHRPPLLIAKLRCLGFACTSRNGANVQIENMETGEIASVGYIPSRPFDLDVFMSVPHNLKLKWNLQVSRNGGFNRSMSYALLIKTRSKSDWYSAGATMCETPNKFRELYPSLTI